MIILFCCWSNGQNCHNKKRSCKEPRGSQPWCVIFRGNNNCFILRVYSTCNMNYLHDIEHSAASSTADCWKGNHQVLLNIEIGVVVAQMQQHAWIWEAFSLLFNWSWLVTSVLEILRDSTTMGGRPQSFQTHGFQLFGEFSLVLFQVATECYVIKVYQYIKSSSNACPTSVKSCFIICSLYWFSCKAVGTASVPTGLSCKMQTAIYLHVVYLAIA